MTRKLFSLGLLCASMMLGIAPARAQVNGDCDLTFNGIEVDRIDSLNSPLELDTGDTLIFSGIEPTGTQSAYVRLLVGPVTIKSNTTTYTLPEQRFLATIPLDDVGPYSVGLFRVEGTTDGCSAAIWFRLSGRFPLTTLAGLTAMGLALGGVTGQLGAIASRRRWARSAAALGGIATGAGLTLLGQEFGRLQVSYPSLAGFAIVLGGLGVVFAWIFNPTIRRRRQQKGMPRPTARRESQSDFVSASEIVAPIPAPGPVVKRWAPSIDPEAAPLNPQGATDPQPALPDSPYWCYVTAPTDVFDLIDHTRTIAVIEPENWYLAQRTLGGWVQVVTAAGTEGWVAEGAIHRRR